MLCSHNATYNKYTTVCILLLLFLYFADIIYIIKSERMKNMTTANKITILRIILVPIFMAFLLMDNIACQITALIIFIIAAASDGIDGYIARHYNQITTFGKFMDPLADKMLTTAAFLILLEQGRITWLGSVAVMLVLAREFMVAGLRMVSGAEGKVIAASMFGKIKTVSQMFAIIASILLMNENWFVEEPALLITNILIWVSTIITVISGIDYLWKNKDVFSSK